MNLILKRIGKKSGIIILEQFIQSEGKCQCKSVEI